MSSALFWGAVIFVLFAGSVFLVFYFFFLLQKREREIKKDKEELTRRLYELAILKELGERVGYSLNVEEILQIITGSLRQFIDYSAVGYIVLSPDRLKIHTHIDKPVSRLFLKEMKDKMVASLGALTDRSFDQASIEEIFSGAIVVPDLERGVGSLFNIPLVIAGQVAGVLTIAHIDQGLYKEADMTILYKITNQASEAVSRLQEVVRMEQGKLNAMVLSMGDGVLMVDNEYRIIVANPAVKNIIKFKAEKPINIFDFVDALGGKFDIHGRLEEAIVNGSSYLSGRINIEDAFFEIGVYPVTHSPLKGNRETFGAVVVFHDVTKDIELEKVRDEFTSMIVHELRSPLDGVKKIIELLVGEKVAYGSSEYSDYLKMVYQSSSSMLELVNDILDLSKIQAGKFEIHREKASIKEVVQNRITFYKVSADTRNINLSAVFDQNLPELADFDPQAIKQTLNNFLSNAIKFTSAQGSIIVSTFIYSGQGELPEMQWPVKPPVFPTLTDFDLSVPSICIVVSDTGLGIPEESIKELFHTYKQASLSPVTNDDKGTGLGLVIAKGIVDAHKGTIGVVSKHQVGTSFFFTIPIE